MYVAVEGCAHGELDIIYKTILESEKFSGKKIDLLICCGDFQATRNRSDLTCMAVPDKYKEMGSFYKYYSGEKVAPVLTLFIGGNHEASNHLQELSYGGWVAPNIYYLGSAGVVNIGGLRIAGISGVYKGYDYMKGRFERAPYDRNTIRSIYHIRNLEVFRLKQLTGKIDIFISHDWPQGITQYGNLDALLRIKPFFREDIERNQLGSPPAMELLTYHKPTYWFSAHMHCKFSALVPEKDGSRLTKFVALDKCLPRRKFLQVFEIESPENASMDLTYDLEWLCILYFTNHLLSVKSSLHYMPSGQESAGISYIPSSEEKQAILKKFNCDLKIPKNFHQTVDVFNPENCQGRPKQPNLTINYQTSEFCNILGIDDPLALIKLMDPSPKYIEEKSSSIRENSPVEDSSFEKSFISDSISDLFGAECLEVVMDKVCEDKVCEEKVVSSNIKNSLSPLKLPPVSDNGSDEDEFNSSKRSSEMEKSEDIKDEKPVSKKLKRRNQSIYADSS